LSWYDRVSSWKAVRLRAWAPWQGSMRLWWRSHWGRSGTCNPGDLLAFREMFPQSMPEGSLDLVGSLPTGGPARVALLLVTGVLQAAFFAGFGALGALLFDRLFPARRGPGAPAQTPEPGESGSGAGDGAD
jgi:hypothetical protein